jgi:hypothetical protein
MVRVRSSDPCRIEAFDGDTVSVNVAYTEQSIREIDEYFESRRAHVNPSGGLRASAAIDTTELVLHNITH